MWKNSLNMKRRGVFAVGIVILVGSISFWGNETWGIFDNERMTCEIRVVFEENLAVCAEVADSKQEQIRGLSGRDVLREGTGMIFDFGEEVQPMMWMKDMRIALDFVWIRSDGQIVGFTQGVTPDTYPRTFSSPEAVRFVLEVPSGWVERNGVQVEERVLLVER